MPSINIHIAIANEYMKYHPKEIKNRNDFIKGSFAPDLCSDKYESHYGNYSKKHNGLSKFMKQNEIDINSDFGKGYFLHLIADELFYHNTFQEEYNYVKKINRNFHHDWDCLNKPIIDEYEIREVPQDVMKYFNRVLEEKPEFLDFKKVKKFIDSLSRISLENQLREIQNNGNPII